MRRLETATREQKRIRDTVRSSGDKVLVKKCNERIKAYRAKYDEIAEKAGITPDYKRMSVQKPQNISTSTEKSSIIKEGNKTPITPITENAINNVKKINIGGFTDEQNRFIQSKHKELLKYAKDNNSSGEVAFVFRKGLTDRAVFVGADNIIDFGNGLDKKGDNLFVMHNHPRNSGFSNLDINFFISNDNIKSFSIVKNNGLVEIITKTEKYSIEKIKVIYGRAYKKSIKNGTKEEIDKAIEYLLNKNGGIVEWKK